MNRQGLWAWLNGVFLLAFVALLIVLPLTYAVIPLLAALVMLAGFLLGGARSQSRLRLDRDDAWMLLALLLYAALWLLDVWRTGQWPVGEGNQGIALPLWPLLAAALLVWLRWHAPEPRLLWGAVCAGALMAGGIALYERWWLGYARAHNQMNAIPFGNLSLLLGTLSLLTVLWCLRRGYPRSPALLALSVLAAVSGILGSLLSGTRGWVALPFLLLLIYRAARDLLPGRWRHGLAVFVAALVVGAALLPQSGVVGRVALAVSDVQQYWQQDIRGTSVGLRLEMWRGGALLVLDKPWLGWGEGRLETAIDEKIAAEVLHPGIGHYDQLHSDMIDTLARRGLVGLVGLWVLYAVPLCLCWRRLRRPGADPGLQVLAAAGMMVPVAFIDFGLTQSMLRDVRGLSGYLGLCVACWVALRTHEARLNSRSRRGMGVVKATGKPPRTAAMSAEAES